MSQTNQEKRSSMFQALIDLLRVQHPAWKFVSGCAQQLCYLSIRVSLIAHGIYRQTLFIR